MRRGRSTGSQTRAEAAWVDAVKASGCICCGLRGYVWDEDGPLVEAHHLLSGGIRRGHMDTVGLCIYHHRGRKCVDGWSMDEHRRMLGPSLMDGSVPFAEAFGTDDELLALQREKLRGVLAA